MRPIFGRTKSGSHYYLDKNFKHYQRPGGGYLRPVQASGGYWRPVQDRGGCQKPVQDRRGYWMPVQAIGDHGEAIES